MEFLLVSQRKHRTWIILKQLLLLLLRIARRGRRGAHGRPAACCATSGAACWAARRRTTSCCWTTASRCRTAGATPAPSTRPRRWSSGSAPRPPGRRSRRPFTLLRFSQVGRPGRGTAARPGQGSASTPSSPPSWRTKLQGDRSLADGGRPAPALEALDQLLGDAEGERRIVYLISDFRARQWDEPTELEAAAGAAERGGVGTAADRLRRTRRGRTWRSPPWSRPRGSARPGCPVHGSGGAELRRRRRPRTCPCCSPRTAAARPALTIAEIPPGRVGEGAVSRLFPAGRRSTSSPPGWRATPWRPTTSATPWSICRPRCRCCWSTAIRRRPTPAT